MLTSFAALENRALHRGNKVRVVVASAHDSHTLEGIHDAFGKGLIEAVLIGDVSKIKAIIALEKLSIGAAEIIAAENDVDAAKKAVALIASGAGDVLMKGGLPTDVLLREVVNKDEGLTTGNVISHVGLFHIPTYHKLVILTDGGMIIAPNAAQKKELILNAVDVLKRLNIVNPKVAVLCATEKESPKMQASVDAALLKKQWEDGAIDGCIIDGPISFDLMFDSESARIKGYESPVVGDADILLMPDMTAGNLVAKTLLFAAKSTMAGLIVGARCPIVLVSRGATAQEKYLSLVFAAAIADR